MWGRLVMFLRAIYQSVEALRAENPEVVLRPQVPATGPETSKLPKVVRRGCTMCFGAYGPKASCTGAKQGCTGARDPWETISPAGQNTFCTLPKPLWANLRFRASVASTQSRKIPLLLAAKWLSVLLAKNGHTESRTQVTSMGGLYDAATLCVLGGRYLCNVNFTHLSFVTP